MEADKIKTVSFDPIARLLRTMAEGKHSHAYLLYGTPGVGKRTLAGKLAAAILCQSPDAPCGHCNVCRKLQEGIHPDLWRYEGREGKNAIHIETIRQLRADAAVRPNESEYKIYILPNAENLSPGGANAFLKLLEEPPPHVVFFLTAASREAVLSTILSRCVPVFVPPMQEETLTEALRKSRPDAAPEKLCAAVRQSDGIIGRALSLLDREQPFSSVLQELTDGICSRSEYTILRVLTQNCGNQAQFQSVLEELLFVVRSSLQQKVLPQEGITLPMASKLTLRQLTALAELTELTKADLQSNVHPGLAIQHFAAQIMEILLPSVR